MGLIRSLFWFGLFLGATFAFTVIFEHGFPSSWDQFKKDSEKEYDYLSQMVGAKPAKRPDKSDDIGGGVKQ